MIRLLSKKIVMAISTLALAIGMHAVEDKSANATTASKAMTALASAGIFAGVAATTMNSFASQLPQYKNSINDRMQQYVLIAVPAALVTFGAITYLCKSARSWKAILSSLVGSTTLALSGLLFGASCCEITSHPAAVNSGFFYVVVPGIVAGSAIFGYLMQPKKESSPIIVRIN